MTTIDKAIAHALTAESASRAASPAPEVVIVRPEKDSPLESLLCLYEARKAAHDAADTEWEDYKAALVSALRTYEPDENVKEYEVPATPMWPAVAVSWRNGREYLPTKLIRQHIPQVWDAFKQTTRGYWDVRRKGKR